MYFPTLSARPRSQQTVDVFAGYNHNVRIKENEFFDMENLTSDQAPVICPRSPRGLYLQDVNVQGMIAKDCLCYVDGSEFVIGENRVDMGLSTLPEDCPKQLVSMGAYVIILPDKKYINTTDTTDFGDIEAQFIATNTVTAKLCNISGEAYSFNMASQTPPSDPEDLEYWLDTSSEEKVLKRYSASSGMWTSVSSTYVKLEAEGIGALFKQHDGVTISGFVDAASGLNGSTVLWGCSDDYIVISGIIDRVYTQQSLLGGDAITVSRKMPNMDFIIESENRLWGCRYGTSVNGEMVNEIYASKLGDFKNWNCFMGVSTDSYVVSVGSDGPFTGAIAFAGHPLFWKENFLHTIFGQIPANFSIQSTACRGVQKGSHGSLAIVNEILFYKSRGAVCGYDGSVPAEVSAALGEVRYVNALAVAQGNKYYINMQNATTGISTLMVYDTAKGLWHREDDLKAYLLCSCRDEIYCATGDGRIITLLGSGERYEETVPWMLETGILGASLAEKKYLVKLNIRLVLEPGSSMNILAQYDSVGPWENLGFITGTDLRSFSIPVKPRRCDHLRLRIEAEGKGMIFSISKTYSYGSDK